MENSFYNYFNQHKVNLSFSCEFESAWIKMDEPWLNGEKVTVAYDSFSAFLAGGEL
jgi:hypothetical protein